MSENRFPRDNVPEKGADVKRRRDARLDDFYDFRAEPSADNEFVDPPPWMWEPSPEEMDAHERMVSQEPSPEEMDYYERMVDAYERIVPPPWTPS
jgi:hypothetical protein